MFERFTERARQVIVLAQDEGRSFKHNYIGTEHLLLGLLREEEGLAACVLDNLDITIEEVRAQVARIVGFGEEVATGEIPFTPRAKKALELALREALSLGHNYIGTEHILLGLVRETEGVGAQILLDFGSDADTIRIEIIRMLSGPGRQAAASGQAAFNFLPERFTERANQVILLAEDEARNLNHERLHTEHLLLGILREDPGRVLARFGITIDEVRRQVIEIVGTGDDPVTGPVSFTPEATQVLESAWREALSLGHNHIRTEHILLGLLREEDGLAARILRSLNVDAERIRYEIMGMLSGPGEEGSTETQHYEEPPPLRVGCPHCATVIETITTQQRNRHFQVAMQGDHTCPGCGRRWAITDTAAWTDPSPPADPDDDLPSEMTVYRYSQPAHFTMTCFRCDQALERVTLDRAAPSLAHVEDDRERTCPSCRKPWRISYSVSWEERPGGSPPSRGGYHGVGE